MAIGSLSKLFSGARNLIGDVADIGNRQSQEQAALEAKRKELADAGTPFISTDKLGDLVFEKDSFYTDYTIDGQVVGKDFVFYDPLMSKGAKAANQVVRYTGGVSPQYRYTFIPENIIDKGFKTDDKQYYLGNILAGDNLDALSQTGVYVDLAGVKDFDKQFKDQGISTKGFLIPYAETEQRDLFSNIKNYDIGKASEDNTIKWGEIKGLSKSGDQYIYATDATPIGGVDKASGYINAQGLQGNWYKKPSGGGFLGDLGRAIADVPFGAELLGLATMNPYVYAAASGLRGGATGQDPLKVGLQTGLTAGIASSLSGAGAEPSGAGVLPDASSIVVPDSLAAPFFPGDPSAIASTGMGISGGGLSSAEMAALKTGTGYGETVQSLLNQDLAFVGADAAQLYNTTGSVAATQQNLLAAGVDPIMAAEASNLAALGGTGSSIASSLGAAFPGETVFTSQGLLAGGSTLDPFAKEIAGISSTPAPSLSITDALRGANLANQLMGGGQQTATGFPQQQAPFQPMGVDYSGIYGLLGQRASVPGIAPLLGPAQLRYPSLLG